MKTQSDHDKARDKFLALSGLSFKDGKLLETAFTHRSYINEARSLANASSFSAMRCLSSR